MKKILPLILIIFAFGWYNPAFSFDDFEYMSIEEYSRFFELGLTGSDEYEEYTAQDETEDAETKVKLKEKADIEGENVINLEPDNIIKLKVEKTGFFDSYKEMYSAPDAKNELFKTENFSLFSDSKQELSDYMTVNLKSTLNAAYDFNDALSLRAGQEIWYVNPDARAGAKKLYFNPRLNIGKRFYLDYTSKFNQESKYVEQEIGVNYKPKCLKDTANFGIKATAVINDTNKLQSGKLKFSSDFYLF